MPTLQGGESPMPDSGSPIVPHDGGRNVAEPSASNAGQRPVSRRQALAYGSSLAAALPPHPPRPLRPRHRRRPPAQRLSVSLAPAKRIVAAAERRPTDRRVDVHCGGRRLRRDQAVVADGWQQPGQRHRGSAQGCARQRVPDPTATLAQGPAIRPGSPRSSEPALAWLDRMGTLPRNRLNPQEASNDGADPLRPARWRIRHRSRDRPLQRRCRA